MNRFRYWLSLQLFSLWLWVTPKCDSKIAIVRAIADCAEDCLHDR